MRVKTYYIILLSISINFVANGFQSMANDTLSYKEFSGVIYGSESNDPLVFADLEVENTNIRTVANTDGEFILKVPNELLSNNLVVSYLGYQKKILAISSLTTEGNTIYLDELVTRLDEVNIASPKSAEEIVSEMLNRKNNNYINQNTLMTAFYRETIRKRRQNASLAEAVVEVYKQPYNTLRNDKVKLIKSRKSTNYSKLDTLAIKLQGGPFNTLYSDLIKYPEFVFNDDYFSAYVFELDKTTKIDERRVYVVSFRQKREVLSPLYYGKLYIDAQTYALNSAVYNLNVENEDLAAELFVKRKPRRVTVTPTEAAYRVDYKNKDGRWYYGYSNIQLTFRVNWKGKIFNSVYTLHSEMVITDWKESEDNPKFREQIKPSVILADEASGFSDPEFWGEYNIIEPEKSIEQAIRKINRNLEKQK